MSQSRAVVALVLSGASLPYCLTARAFTRMCTLIRRGTDSGAAQQREVPAKLR
jgi:hypothetical protein